MNMDPLRPEDIPIFNITATLNTKTLTLALSAVSTAARAHNFKSIFMVINPGVDSSGIALIGGNERNLIFMNIHGEVDRKQSMVVFAFAPDKIYSMIRGLEDPECTITLDAATENLTIKDSQTTYTLLRMGLDTRWVARLLSKTDDAVEPTQFTLTGDCIGDLGLIAGSTFGDSLEEQNNKVFVLASAKKVAFVKTTSKVVTVVKHNSITSLVEPNTLVVPFTANSLKNIIIPFVLTIDGNNTVKIYESFIRVEKDGSSNFCIIPRATTTNMPFGLIKRLTKYSNHMGSIICNKTDLDKLGTKVSAVIQDTSIATRLEYENSRIRIQHKTSSGSVNTEINHVEHVFYKRDGCDATREAAGVTANIDAVSVNRLAEIVKYFYGLSRQQSRKKEPVTLKLYKGGFLPGKDPNVDSMDYTLIGSDDEEFVLISCHVNMQSENVPTYIPTLIE